MENVAKHVLPLGPSSHYPISLLEFNFPLIGSFTWLTPPGPYRATTCRGRKLISGSHTYFLTTQEHGGPPWMMDQLNYWATSEIAHTWKTIHTRQTLSFQQGEYEMMIMAARWCSGTFMGLTFPYICLTGEEKPRKNLTQETYADRESNPAPLRDRRTCYRLFRSGGPSFVN